MRAGGPAARSAARTGPARRARRRRSRRPWTSAEISHRRSSGWRPPHPVRWSSVLYRSAIEEQW